MAHSIARQITEEIPRLRAYARFIARDANEADDLLQTCLERALCRAHQFQPGTNLRAWLFTILRHAHINEIRREARRPRTIDVTEHDYLFPVAPPQNVQLEMQEFWAGMARLPQIDRDVLEYIGIEGLSYQDAADRLHVPIGTVRSRLSRARGRMKASLAGNVGVSP